MKTITTTVSAWLGEDYGPEDLLKDPDSWMHTVAFFSTKAEMSRYGYTLVGEADITIRAINERELFANKVSSLRAQQTEVRANAEHKINRIEEQIQNLLAITYDAATDE